jgi:hypothetical protein
MSIKANHTSGSRATEAKTVLAARWRKHHIKVHLELIVDDFFEQLAEA